MERSPEKSVIKCCSVMKPPSSSNQPQPMRNAWVPAPPLRPVVSRSKKTNGISVADRPTNEAADDASSSCSANSITRWRPCRSAGANRLEMTNDRPDGVSRQLPPRASIPATFSLLEAGGVLTSESPGLKPDTTPPVGLTMPRSRSFSVEISISGRQLVRQQEIQDAKCSSLCQRSGIAERADAAWATALALAFRNQTASRLEKLMMHPK